VGVLPGSTSRGLDSIADPRALLLGLFELAPVAFQVYRADGHCLLVNDAFRQLFGSEPPPEYNLFEDDVLARQGLQDLVRRAFAGETVQVPPHWYDPRELEQLEVRVGRRVGISVTLFPLRDAEGAVAHVALCFKDVTAELERQRERDQLQVALEALQRSDARKAAIMEAALDAIVVMDHEGKIADFNPAAEQLFGYRRDEALGRSLGDTIVPPRLREAHRRGLARYLESSIARVLGMPIELPAIRRDGSEFPAEIAVLRIGAPGKPMFVGYIRDSTVRHRAAEAEALRRVNEAAEAAYLELEAFSYSVAQDLRSPLRTMSDFGTALLEDHVAQLDEVGCDYVRRIVAGSRRMSEVVDGLLTLARLAKAEIQYDSFDLAALARSLIPLYSDPVREAVWNIEQTLPVRGDRRLLRALLEHLLSNAWKFTRTRRVAEIELGRLDRGQGTFYVRDNGIGFDGTRAQALFAPFQRHHVEPEYAGAGLGLATAQRIVHRHGGRIWAEAEVDRGATFYFTLSPSGARGRDTPASGS
jgi:PAS domain S-box-containing protein